MPKRKKAEPSSCSDESLLSFASDEERAEIAALLREIDGDRPAVASDDGRVCTTMAEAAVALGVTTATLDKWMADPTFPGKRGTRGRAAASFPIGEIRQWRERKYGTSRTSGDAGSESRQRKAAAEAALKELEFERRAGALIERERAEAIYVATVSTARSLLEDLPQRIAAALPATRPKLRRKVESLARRCVLQVLDALAGDLDKQEEADEQEEASE